MYPIYIIYNTTTTRTQNNDNNSRVYIYNTVYVEKSTLRTSRPNTSFADITHNVILHTLDISLVKNA